MKNRTLAVLWGIVITIIIGMVVGVYAKNPTFIVGVQSECDSTFSGCATLPTTVTTLCSSACALRTSFSFTNPLRFWGASSNAAGACSTSVNGGVAWAACTSQAFAAGNGREMYVGAGDGGVLAAGTLAGPVCTIRRSTDNGTNWSTVASLAATRCDVGSALEGQYFYCLSSGLCEIIVGDAVSSLFRTFRSSDFGANWAAGETGAFPAGGVAGAISWNGIVGMIWPNQTGGANTKSFSAIADVYTSSADWANVGNCWGGAVYNGTPVAICWLITNYTVRSKTGALVNNLTLPGALALVDSGGPAISIATNSMYVFASTATGTGVYLSRDGLATFSLLSTITTATRGGNTFYANGCVYATITTTPKFIKIC